MRNGGSCTMSVGMLSPTATTAAKGLCSSSTLNVQTSRERRRTGRRKGPESLVLRDVRQEKQKE